MFSKIKSLVILLILSLLAVSCGDLLGKKVVKKDLGSGISALECEMNFDRFSKIMKENLGPEIRCLGENLNFFIKIVKSGKPGYLSRVQLESYLQKHRPDVKPEFVKALKSVFNLGHLITGDDPDYISKDTIDKVVEFALIFNREAALHYNLFMTESAANIELHRTHRDRIKLANFAIIEGLRKVLNRDQHTVRKFNIIELLENFTTVSNGEEIEKVKKVLFVKKILMGGEEQVVTHLELEQLIFNFDRLVLIAFDLVRYKYIDLNQNSLMQLLKTDVEELYTVINRPPLDNRAEEVLFTIPQAIEAVKQYVDAEKFDIEKFRGLIVEVKKILMTGNGEAVKAKEINVLFDHAKSLLKTGTLFHHIYDAFKVQLAKPDPVEYTINFDDYRHTYPENQAELKQFERIAKKYRFMKGKTKSGYYTKGSVRNPEAFVEIAFLEYAITLIYKNPEFGLPSTGTVGGYSSNQKLFRQLMVKFEKELIELDLITPQRVLSTSDNISLLGTLFQYQSDDNGVMDVNETAEFGESLLSSLNMAKDIKNYMIEQTCPKDEFDRIQPECFRKNFWKGLCTGYREFYPKLFQYLNVPAKCEEINSEETIPKDFLLASVKAARGCNFYDQETTQKEEVPFSEGDIMTILLAMMHTETTILRWDENGNNIMDPDEVMKAYKIYSPALDGFLSSQSPIIRSFKTQIYQYMIKYEDVPDPSKFNSIMKFIKFLLSFNKKAPATRKTMVAILGVIGEQNAKLLPTKFDCNLLRNPDTIPRTPTVINPGPVVKEASEDYSHLLEPYINVIE